MLEETLNLKEIIAKVIKLGMKKCRGKYWN